MAPSSFASAAAGTNSSASRADASAEWARRTNGATQTFRRPSHATTPSGSAAPAASRDAPIPSAPTNSTVYVPPHAQHARNGQSIDSRYSREQLTQLFKSQQTNGELTDGVSGLCVGPWDPLTHNGVPPGTWNRNNEHAKDHHAGVEQAWDFDGITFPLSLQDLTHDEREFFLSSVNSPLKPPIQNTGKDATPKDGLSLRKSSISQAAGTPYGLSSPTSARPGGRRRDTSEAYPFPQSPAASRFAREDAHAASPPPSLVRRRTDFKEPTVSEQNEDRDKERGAAENSGPFGGLKRTTTAPFSPGGSAWATQGGAFAAFGNFGNPPNDKKPGFGSIRGESRFKGLMAKASIEDFDKAPKEKISLSNLGQLGATDTSKRGSSWMEARSNRPMSNDTDPFPDVDVPSGSAALRGEDVSPPRAHGLGAFGTPVRQDHREDNAFSAFGMTAHARDGFAHQTPYRPNEGGPEPMSPTNTNPYQSPDHAANDHDGDSDDPDLQNAHYPGMGSFQIDSTVGSGLHNAFGGLGGLGRPAGPLEPADRSQTSSVGHPRTFPALPGLGTLPGLSGTTAWSAGSHTLGTPIRERGLGGFDSAFGNAGEAQSPSLAGLGSSALFGSGASSGQNTVNRTSRLGSLFPTAMQEQMRSNEQQKAAQEDSATHPERQQNLSGTFGRNAFASQAGGVTLPPRDNESPFRANRSFIDDFPAGSTDDHNKLPFGHSAGPSQSSHLGTTSLSMAALNNTRTAHPSPPGISSPASSQPPTAQQRTMVMPDRMRWIYRDPSGNTQGPFSGLEMHDWYKAGFFSPELLVRKMEEPEYEPLAQLIRRIGNSREPFLVPQIGIAHGLPPAQQGNAWPGTAAPNATPGTQPPFANSFPSFGTTLTAEQQNALERRKQEEQYLMARQKEHLAAQQQALARQVQMGGMLPGQLHHHSSAHSLHSQPSYGSITSPGGFQQPPNPGVAPGGPIPNIMENAFRQGPGMVPGLTPIGPGMEAMGNAREEDVSTIMDRLNIGRNGQPPYGTAPPSFGQQTPESNTHAQQVVAMLNDRARLHREQVEHDAMQRFGTNDQQASQASAERLQQFNELRLTTDMESQAQAAPQAEGVIGQGTSSFEQHQNQQSDAVSAETSNLESHISEHQEEESTLQEPLSLTEQVQKAASAKQSPQPLSAWNKVEPAIFPFPPPPSQSPLPAPAAQRKPIVAENLTAEPRSGAATPAAETPSASVAPWAKEPAEAARGPSLREIQEAEAKKAAEREAVAAAARREALEKEMLAQAQASAPQPGLPSSSTWASGASPITPIAAGASPWAKPAAGKTPAQQVAASKKTLQQIQKEEEARKQRVAAQAALTANVLGLPAQASPAGKRYADLASKVTPIPPTGPSGNSAWTTVGASGKVKTPGGVPPPPAAVRSTSGMTVPTLAKKPAVTRTATATGPVGKVNAEEEFRKWAINELRQDLNKGINAEDFVSSLLSFPADAELITESVHSASNTLDSRHFAEEFLRRRKLADKGIFDERNSGSPAADSKAGGSGWSEVAKKGSQPQAVQSGGLETGNFKVVAAKKKGKR